MHLSITNQRVISHRFPLLFALAIVLLGLVVSAGAVMAALPSEQAGKVALGTRLQTNVTAGEAGNAPTSLSVCTISFTGVISTSDPTQLGRLVTVPDASTCNNPRPCPGVLDSLPRHYDAYTLVNPNNTAVCVTVELDPLITGGLLQSAAYLGSFDPLNPCANYLADIGPIPSALGGSYSFNVAAGATFVVTVNELIPNQGTLGYDLTVTTDPLCQVTATPTSTPNVGATQTYIAASQTAFAATQTAIAGTGTTTPPTATSTVTHTPAATATPCVISGSITMSDGNQLGRLNSLLVASTCSSPRPCPGILDNFVRHYDAYTYANATGSTVCITVDLTNSCLNDVLIQSAAYLGSFDPTNLCANYLADIGPSTPGIDSYSFNVPPGATYVIVVNELVPNLGCTSYQLSVQGPSGGICPVTVTPTPNSATQTARAGGTQTAIAGTQTALARTPTATACPLQFTDVPPGHTFYDNVRCLVCRGIISGYADRTFRPNNFIVRGQIAKIVSNSANFSDPAGGQIYQDVPPSDTFYVWINRLSNRGYMGGYPCGTIPTEPCLAGNRPYFRPYLDASRGQISKIVSNAAGFGEPPGPQFYTDVAPGNPFYDWINRLTYRGVMSGYDCGGINPQTGQPEPCDALNRPYFRWGNNVTRGQASKIDGNAFFPNCQTP